MTIHRPLFLAPFAALLLSGCAVHRAETTAAAPVRVDILAFNDFHGNLQPPHLAIKAPAPGGGTEAVPAGGAAYFAAAVRQLRAQTPYSVTVSAGDLVGASPLVSSLFLDEPTVEAMNMIGLDFSAVGNHEFDRGREELLRKQQGGCDRHTAIQPCQVISPFPGASFRFLAGNTLDAGGNTLFPATGIKSFAVGRRTIRIGFIGLTLKGTGDIVAKSGIAGLHFADEAESANAQIPRLRAQGAQTIVLLLHQGGETTVGYNDKSCAGLSGDIRPILDRLDPAIDVVISGHTHKSYICDYGRMNPAKPFLLTSAGQYGTLLTRITLSIDPKTGHTLSKTADNLIVQGEGYTGSRGPVPLRPDVPAYKAEGDVAALVDRYARAAAPLADRVVGHVAAPLLRSVKEEDETPLGSLIADAQLAATRAPEAGGAHIAFMNAGGIRQDIVPGADGAVTFGQLFAAQPFGNTLMTRSYTGAQLLALLEQQFAGATPNLLQLSDSLHYRYDLRRPAGQRVFDVRIDGAPLKADAVYRVAASNFLMDGGDGFTAFRAGTNPVGGPQDIDALERYIAAHDRLAPPAAGRAVRIDD